MDSLWTRLATLVARIWHPVALPEEIAGCFGLKVSNFLSVEDLIGVLCKSQCYTTCLSRYMPREIAESVFRHATSVESFGEKTIISYYFRDGWVEYVLLFDQEDRLRRIYLYHRAIEKEGIEIPLTSSYIGHRIKFNTARLKQRQLT
ncbi:hypothetical protein [Estrella lausannensis]|uniref:Uncharacterized protein n=1 Tax=Estrella lausannensis TaxID=483423 RepID=A0A0H5DQZ3_9BACT|nr:hypothetical protein [Estrella lausannensis]CRX38044.1 Conserved hypothetical protein [Estrella lausannensis]